MTADVDAIVVGAGMAGLTAAAVAASEGARVLLVEKAAEVGGSAALSGGLFWTAKSLEAYREQSPDSSPEIAAMIIDNYEPTVEWIRSTGASVGPGVEPLQIPHGFGRVIDIYAYLTRCRSIIEGGGGMLIRQATAAHLLLEGQTVGGIRLVDRDGSSEVRAGSVVLATGGFQGNSALRAKFIGAAAADILVRANPYSDGAGLELGRGAGAALSPHMHGFYGHLIARPLRRTFETRDFIRLSQSIYSQYACIVGVDGRRITDESLGYYRNAQALMNAPERRAVVIADSLTRLKYAQGAAAAGMEAWDRPREAAAEGARVAEGETIGEICAQAAAWRYDADGMRRTLARFNDAMTSGTATLSPGRRYNRRPLAEAPFFAVEVQPAITFTHGGLAVDASARVLDSAAQPIRGLFVAGADAGGVFSVGYAGGLASAAILGRRAALTILGLKACDH